MADLVLVRERLVGFMVISIEVVGMRLVRERLLRFMLFSVVVVDG